MKLKLRFKPTLSQIIWGIIIILAAFFFLRVALWENAYYQTKEGSDRAPVVNNLSETTAIDETPVTDEEAQAYTVPSDYPRYLSIPDLGIENARVLHLGLGSNGRIATPVNIYDAAWYNESALPGHGGTVVINGHNGANLKGIFKQLKDLKPGAKIELEVGGGNTYIYQVVENTAIPLDEADAYMRTALKSPVSGQESLTLISCSGSWDYTLHTYDHRQFVRAILQN